MTESIREKIKIPFARRLGRGPQTPPKMQCNAMLSYALLHFRSFIMLRKTNYAVPSSRWKEGRKDYLTLLYYTLRNPLSGCRSCRTCF